MRRAAPLLLLLLLLTAAAARADVPAGRAAIKAEAVGESVGHLASDDLEGRGSGAEGGRRAGEWLAAQLRALGVQPAGTDGYFQPFTHGGVVMRNVLGAIEGREPGEQVVIGAHYDHLGLGHQQGSLELLRGRGRIHNGADDNASGTAAVLEVARAFVASGERPRRRVVFAWFDGEERGLLGSKHLVAHPVSADRTTLMLNLDMVGRLKGKLVVYGAGTGDRLGAWLRRANDEVGLELDLRETMPPNSDHASYYEKGIPVLAPFTGLHADYHRPSDDAGRVNVEGVAQVARLTFGVAAIAAEEAGPLAFARVRDGSVEAVLEQAEAMLGPLLGEGAGDRLRELLGGLGGGRDRAPAGRPRLGITVSPGEGGGLTVDSVSAGSPAARAGLHAGDRILEAAGARVDSVEALRARLGAASVALGVEREGRSLTLTVELEARPAPTWEPGRAY